MNWIAIANTIKVAADIWQGLVIFVSHIPINPANNIKHMENVGINEIVKGLCKSFFNSWKWKMYLNKIIRTNKIKNGKKALETQFPTCDWLFKEKSCL